MTGNLSSERKTLEYINKSVNEHILCDSCGNEFEDKQSLDDHVRLCTKKESNEIEIKNNKLGFAECEERKSQLVFYCKVCEKNFFNDSTLRYHIRRVHFNLKGRVPYFYRKKVNQIWFEKVMNSNKILEIRKASPNTLILRRLSENTAIKVSDLNTDMIDLSNVYPTYSPTVFTTCDVCEKKVFKQSFLQHRKKHDKLKTKS